MLQAYRAIIELLEKYWVMAVVYTSGRSVPPQVPWPQALEVMARHLMRLRPRTTTYVPSYYYIYVLLILHMCPHTTYIYVIRLDIAYYAYVSLYNYVCPDTMCVRTGNGCAPEASVPHSGTRDISGCLQREWRCDCRLNP
jgi:hypothetical protein